MISFNVPPFVGTELEYIKQAIDNQKICGDGAFTKRCSELLESMTKSHKVLLTTSCSHALDMSAMLCDIQEGDEVIMPSYTFVSTANAFVLRGAKIVFVDIRPDTMNIDETKIEKAITSKTKAIVPVHYAGVACEMYTIMGLAAKYNLYVVEDAAQGVMSTYKGRPLGTIGDIGCYSFHETKNYSSGEGGAILINNEKFIERAEIIREKGTNRTKFFRGQLDKYTWVDVGSSYLPSEINAAYLFAQLENADKINNNRLASFNNYCRLLKPLANEGKIALPTIPKECVVNGHMFYIKCKNLDERTALISHLKENGVLAVFHYIPLHSAPEGIKSGRFDGEDIYTTAHSEMLVRLPLYYNITQQDVEYVASKVLEFYGK